MRRCGIGAFIYGAATKKLRSSSPHPLPLSLQKTLNDYILRKRDRGFPAEFLFCGRDGGHLPHSTIRRRFDVYTEAAGMPASRSSTFVTPMSPCSSTRVPTSSSSPPSSATPSSKSPTHTAICTRATRSTPSASSTATDVLKPERPRRGRCRGRTDPDRLSGSYRIRIR